MSDKEMSPNNEGIKARRPGWKSSLATFKYIISLKKSGEGKLRRSDHISSLILLFSSLATILCLLLHSLSGLGFYLMVICDIILGSALLVYVTSRLGIITTLTPRQAMLTWQLLKGFVFIGIFIAVNTALTLSIFFALVPWSSTHLP